MGFALCYRLSYTEAVERLQTHNPHFQYKVVVSILFKLTNSEDKRLRAMLVHPDTSFSAVSHKINFRMVSKLEKLEVVLACLERDISFFLGTSILCMSESVVTVQTTFPQLLNSSIVVNSPATDFCELCLAPPFQDHCKDQDKYEEACEESLMSPLCLESQGCHLIPLYYLLSCSSA